MQTQVALLAGHLRLDLAVPAHLPLLEVIPDLVDLARRAGAAVGPDVTLVEAGGERLRSDATLAEQDVRDGALLVLRPSELPIPLTLHHDLVGAVESIVERNHDQVDAQSRRVASTAAALGGAGLLAFTLLSGAVAPVLAAALALAVATVAGLGVRRLPLTATASATVALVLWLGYAPLAGLLWGTAWALRAGGDAGVAAWSGAAGGAALAVLVLTWAAPGRREWAIVPAVLVLVGAVGAGVSRIEIGGASLALPDVVSAVVVLMVMAVAPLVSGLVQAIAVRGAGEDVEPVKVPLLASRVRTAVRCVLALDVAVLVVTLWVTPAWMARGGAGVALWGSVVLVLWARTRGERLRARHACGLLGVALVAAWGVTQGITLGVVSGGAGAVVGPAMVVVLAAAMAGAWAQATLPGGWSRRPVAIGERVLRLALPSLWLLSSGLLA